MKGEFDPVLARFPTATPSPRKVHETHNDRGGSAKTTDGLVGTSRAHLDAKFELQMGTMTKSTRRPGAAEQREARVAPRDEVGDEEAEVKPRIEPASFEAGTNLCSLVRQVAMAWPSEVSSDPGVPIQRSPACGPIREHRADEIDLQGLSENVAVDSVRQRTAQDLVQTTLSHSANGPERIGAEPFLGTVPTSSSIADRPFRELHAIQIGVKTPTLEVITSETHFGVFPPASVLSARSQATLSVLPPIEPRRGTSGSSDNRLVSGLQPVEDGVASIAMTSHADVYRGSRHGSGSHSDRQDGNGSTDANPSSAPAEAPPRAAPSFGAEAISSLPTVTPTISAQVHNRIHETVGDLVRSSPVALGALPSTVRNIEIMLQPESFGPLVLKLKVNAGAMDVTIWTKNAEAAKALGDDKLDLDARLKTAGVELTSLSVIMVPEISGTDGMPTVRPDGPRGTNQNVDRENAVGLQSQFSNGSGGSPRRRDGSLLGSGSRKVASLNNASNGQVANMVAVNRALYV